MKQVKPFLKHIIGETEYLILGSQGIEFNEFKNDENLKRSFVRSLEIIGEATKNLHKDFKNKYPQVEWKNIAGLRDVLIHQYFGIDYRLIWDIVKNKIPKLKEEIEDILDELEDCV
ncbi:MAG: DUF86 domain-containing protein [Nitrospirota bacterium]